MITTKLTLDLIKVMQNDVIAAYKASQVPVDAPAE
jgi:hypothetical protein